LSQHPSRVRIGRNCEKALKCEAGTLTIYLGPDIWGGQFSKIVVFIKVLSMNWTKSSPELLEALSEARNRSHRVRRRTNQFK
jgi:hypothetical protein